MPNSGRSSCRLDRVLDAFASRTGLVATIGIVLAVSLGVGHHVQTLVTRLEIGQTSLQNAQIRNGYVAISDIQRLVLIAFEAAEEGEMVPEMAEEFISATDMLFVRMDTFQRILGENKGSTAGQQAVVSLDKITRIADQAISDDFRDMSGVTKRLIAEFEMARIHLVQYLDDTRRQQDDLVLVQTAAVRSQRMVVIANLLGLTILVSGTLMLLRREVLGRRAREKAERDVAFLAFFDPLTELPNRAHYQDHLNRMLEAGQIIAMIHVDVDEFKAINDTHGHVAGDEVLRHVGGILVEKARLYGGFAARMGGDEFALLLATDQTPVLTGLAEEILASMGEPLIVHGASIDIGLSIGIATSTQVSTFRATPDLLTRVTDFALYASKTDGRGRYTIYDQALEARFRERRAMLEELPLAISSGDLRVFLQPKVALPGRSVLGFEALVRWQRGDQLVPPGEFIELAEESGLVVEIDLFMLNTAVKKVADWNRQYGTDFHVAVNLSALHFGAPRIVSQVEEALWNAAFPADHLTLEITESVELRDWSQAVTIIRELRALGVRVAIDDFGTGFSSLAYLRATMADELKIDRTLVIEVETSKKARLLLSSVIDIAHNLGFSVTVEGIESPGQAQIVSDLGAGTGQGFLFGRPEPALDALQKATGGENSARRHVAERNVRVMSRVSNRF